MKSSTWYFQKCNTIVIGTFMTLAAVLFVTSSVRRSNWRGLIGSSFAEDFNTSSPCNLFSGKWVFDNSTHPLYSGIRCAYMNDEINCDKYGRKDLRYQSWRWQPLDCNLPRFDAKVLLERLRGKRMVYVGDSLNRNQWVSMMCLLESSIADQHKSFVMNGSLMSLRAEEYEASIDFYWSPVLLESNCDDPVNHRVDERIVRANAIEKHASNWADADILIFNSYLWWRKPSLKKMKVLYGSFNDEEKIFKEVEMLEGFELALNTWAEWLALHVDTRKTKVFFVSLSPTHLWAGEWGSTSSQNCYNETEPIAKEGYSGSGSDYRFTKAVETAIEGLKRKGVEVELLNITQLSEYRKDGHPSIYRKQWDVLREDQVANPSSYSDCFHWCLPGVPDAWNEILYAYILST